jgi:hypothetical protein
MKTAFEQEQDGTAVSKQIVNNPVNKRKANWIGHILR